MVGRLDVVTAFGFGVRAWVHKKESFRVHKKESFRIFLYKSDVFSVGGGVKVA